VFWREPEGEGMGEDIKGYIDGWMDILHLLSLFSIFQSFDFLNKQEAVKSVNHIKILYIGRSRLPT
jgi:hypothetical protein